MDSEFKVKARQCCQMEYDHLMERLEMCDGRAGNSKEKHFCYRYAARKNGEATRKCIADL